MTYEKFVEEVLEIIKGKAEGDLEISLHTATKNNGHGRKGIAFSKKGSMADIAIYLEEYYEEYIKGDSMEGIGSRVLEVYHKIAQEHGWLERTAQYTRDYGKIKDRIIYRLVSRKRNRELLPHVPHVDYLDLAALFYVLFDTGEERDQMTSMLVRNEHLACWGISEEEVRRRAEANTEKLLPCKFMDVYEPLQKIVGADTVGDERQQEIVGKECMYVLTNHMETGGASAVLYPGRLEAIGTYFKENYYIIPSSIHEVLLIPEGKAISEEDMEGIVREVNETGIQWEDFLSDHVYYYDREKKEVKIA